MSPVWFRYNRQFRIGIWLATLLFALIVAATIGVFGALAWNRLIVPQMRWEAAPFVVWRALGSRWMARPFWAWG